ncbi:MAG: TIR domain-containing protein, partial [Cyanobacteria bacterium J06633_2]
MTNVLSSSPSRLNVQPSVSPQSSGGNDTPFVFISYSRKTKGFAKVLHQALKKSKYETWIDWQDIPITAHWWKEIESGIESADAIIFVVSPDSIASDVCSKEINHAVKHNKRLFPIVCREGFEDDQVHPALRERNWLFFHQQEGRSDAFNSLVKALNTDLDHVKAHTRLLMRSQEWVHHARNPDLLLRGTQLKAVRNWITESADKEPRLTPSQREYVAASTKAESDRQEAEITRQRAEITRQKKARKTITLALVGASVGFIIATALGLVAWRQQQAAARREINTNVLADSLSTQNLLQSNFQLEALLKGIQTGRTIQQQANVLDRDKKMQAVAALQNVIQNISERNRLKGHTDSVFDVSFSPDGQTIATASA